MVDRVIHGDCLEVMRGMSDCSVDAIVTDPPAGISFMNMSFDDDRGGRTQWIAWLTQIMCEAKRVLKHGGHALVWSLPRTSHWTATALENAGFECRDVIYNLVSGDTKLIQFLDGLSKEQRNAFMQLCESQELRSILHINGTGFPKNTDISKHIDKHLGKSAEREVVGISPNSRFNNNKMYANGNGLRGHESYQGDQITAPATPEAAAWVGYGSALKPSVENWILVRKPLSEKSIAENVLKWGCGGINIDATRVGLHDEKQPAGSGDRRNASTYAQDEYTRTKMFNGGNTTPVTGRFPSNLLLSHDSRCIARGTKRVRGANWKDSDNQRRFEPMFEGGWKDRTGQHYSDEHGLEEVQDFECVEGCPVRELGEQSGVSTGRKNSKSDHRRYTNGQILGKQLPGERNPENSYDDRGTAARYFTQFHDPLETLDAPFYYFAKASRRDRNSGLEGMPESSASKGGAEKRLTVGGSKDVALPRANTHPTVKSLQLMRFLCRLVGVPGGVILDPFCGSGSTLVACVQEGFHFIGIEQSNTPDAPYVDIARARIAYAQQETKRRESEGQEWECHPQCPVYVLGGQSGVSVSKAAPRGGTSPNPMSWGETRKDGKKKAGHSDKVTAARYFTQLPPDPVSLWDLLEECDS